MFKPLSHSIACIAGPSRQSITRSSALSACGICSTTPTWSGHSRWSKIRHKKGAVDAQRAGVFSRILSDIHTTLRLGDDPDKNPRLAAALVKAKEAGVPKSNIESAFARAKKLSDGSGKAVVYEAMGPGGKVALMIECVTDNASKTLSHVKEVLGRRGSGSRLSTIAFMFERKGIIRLQPQEGATFDALFETAVDGGAEDVREVDAEEGTLWEVTTSQSDLGTLTTLLTSPPHEAECTLVSSELAYVPTDPLPILADGEEGEGISEETAHATARCIEFLEEEGDVVKVWSNIAE